MVGLASTRVLAGILNFPLGISWDDTSTLACQAAYSDIFSDPGIVFSAEQLSRRCSGVCDLDLTHFGTVGCWKMLQCDSIEQLRARFQNCSCVRIKSNQAFMEPLLARFGEIYDRPFHYHGDFLFRPSEKINSVISQTLAMWRERFDVQHVIGVHVRSAFFTSSVKDGHLVPQEGVFSNYFWPCVQRIVANVRANKIGIFVAGDTLQVRQEASRILRSDSRVVELNSPILQIPNDTGIGPVREKQVVLDAASELFLLRSCDSLVVKRIGHFDSTFSAVAIALADCESHTDCFIVNGENTCERIALSPNPDLHHVVDPNCSEMGSYCLT